MVLHYRLAKRGLDSRLVCNRSSNAVCTYPCFHQVSHHRVGLTTRQHFIAAAGFHYHIYGSATSEDLPTLRGPAWHDTTTVPSSGAGSGHAKCNTALEYLDTIFLENREANHILHQRHPHGIIAAVSKGYTSNVTEG